MEHTKTPTPEMKALCSLTPGGSEFVNDADTCAEYVRQRFLNHYKLIKQGVESCRKLQEKNDALIEALDSLLNDPDGKHFINSCNNKAHARLILKQAEE